jgi:hypothetical protein
MRKPSKEFLGIVAAAWLASSACSRNDRSASPEPAKSTAPATSVVASASGSGAPALAAASAPRATASTAGAAGACALLDPDGLAIAGTSWGPLRGFTAAVGNDGGSFASVIGRWAYVYDATKLSIDDAKARDLDGAEAVAAVVPRRGHVAKIGRFGASPFGLYDGGEPKAPSWPDGSTRRVFRVGAGARGDAWMAAGVAWKLACETDDDKCTTTIIGGGRGGGELVPTVEHKWDARTGAELDLFFDDGHGTAVDTIAEDACSGRDCEGSRGRWDALSLGLNETHALFAYRDQMQIDVLARTSDGKPVAELAKPTVIAGGGELSRPSIVALGDTFYVVFSMRPKPGAPHAIYVSTWKPGVPKPTPAKLVYSAKDKAAGALGASVTVRPDGKIAIVWAEGDPKSAKLRLGVGATLEAALAAPRTLSERSYAVRDTTVAWGPAFGLIAWSAPADASGASGARPSDVVVRGTRFECP